MAVPVTFTLPQGLNASAPPERRGIRRDHVRLMISDRQTGKTVHTRFYQLARYLRPGDVIVLNTSRTVPAVLQASWMREESVLSTATEIRLAHRYDEENWDAMVVAEGVRAGDRFHFSPSLFATVVAVREQSPLLRLRFSLRGSDLYEQIYALGEPVRYEYIKQPWDLDYYQTVYASVPGSVELPSAGRAFSWEILLQLQKKGVQIAYLILHTGLSYLLDDRFKMKPEENCEQFVISPETAQVINRAKQAGHRIIAVGTTVVRALESAALSDGTCLAKQGWTCLHIDEHTSLKIADGLMTGFHEPEASHLDLLSAFVSPPLLTGMYREAIQERYLWHEFGDIHLII
ncbi:S-adenosylmethionine:tRNA ribosyltransferase-isomerase [Paenactinomyces guangxiensis]|uniref:S-adenosylmethionine:tRNA ribosyltransferase-isomerase n=1 Tax=Paenactinomyces guangxiensis TaxID=1490290 RepID=A0A7W2AAQ6_9BACL|nr:S-adenosylmethionine:tRNA ribosyltransferase-isomerase [Paenactinomyces guangxiensis]MBA4496502.1 S-adenosylmethionine:tRNA ribosyltransferase-isomerase [Paenactinomyces guangxiensis]MBH8593637.1 S-adenosylmethionine:tRNA ribosyltransferase-isomerase [Paenactinomyces guangxiensis]